MDVFPAVAIDPDVYGEALASTPNCLVLLVCDEPETLAALERTVQAEGYRCLSVRHSREALRALEQENVAIIIADQHLPRQTGMELLNTVRERWPGLARILLLGGVNAELLGSPIVQWVAHQILEIPWQEWELRLALRQAAEFFTLWQANAQLLAHAQTQSAQLKKLEAGREPHASLTAEEPPADPVPVQREWEAIGRVLAPADLTAATTDLMGTLLTQVQKVFQAHGAALAVLRSNSDETVIEAGRGAWATQIGQRFPPNAGLAGYLINARQLCLSADWRTDERFAAFELAAHLPAVAGLPLLVPGRIVGALWIGRARPFSNREGQELAAAGRVIAQVLEQALQRDEMQAALRRYEAQQASEQVLAADLPLDSAMQALLENLLTHLHVSAATIWLLDPKARLLEPVIQIGYFAALARQARPLGQDLVSRAIQQRELTQTDQPAEEGDFAEEEFVVGLAVPLIARQHLIGAVEVYNREPLELSSDWSRFLQMLTGQIALIIYNIQLLTSLQRKVAELRTANDRLVESWANCLELRTPLSEGHLPYLVEITLSLARALHVDEAELEHLRRGVILHDIGKLILPDSLLLNNGVFNEADRRLMRQHPSLARDLLAPVSFLQPALDIPFAHHEAWDGSGYPRQLKGEAIPLAARIFAVVDVWDALRSDRPHRRGWPEGKAIEYIRQQSGQTFDPRVVRAFVRLWEDGELMLEATPALSRPR